MYPTLISVAQLKALQASNQALMVFDCSYDLMKPEMADLMFAEKHMQGAQQAQRRAARHEAGLADVQEAQREARGGLRRPVARREAQAALHQGDPPRVADRNGQRLARPHGACRRGGFPCFCCNTAPNGHEEE